ncbi:MAG: cadherin-like beta sandwich domain-containing protein [Bacteroidales bacterium]|nr:cadherin-like beta sandwich domain-containing protein [Bacteroidales bacterium]
MKQKYLLFKFWMAIVLMCFISSSAVFGQAATLKHSYTFEDGTAKDVVGNADGTVIGGAIADGLYTASANGQYIQLPADSIKINTYSAITLEGYIRADVDVTWASMLAYFGDTETGTGNNYGVNYLFITPDRWTESRAAISCNNLTTPWSAEQGVTGTPVGVGHKHHVVCVLTSTTISWYINGVLSGTADVSGDNSIANISTAQAMLCKGGYTGDPTWQGTIDEFNIYEGTLDEPTIQSHYTTFMGDDYFNAKLSGLTTNNSELTPSFDPDVTVYEVNVEYGITSVTFSATPAIEGATVAMFDGLGNEITDGIVTFPIDDGIDFEIVVTALDGSTERSYQVSIFVNPGEESANLSSIDLSAGSFLEDFHPDTTEYLAIVPYGTTSVTVTANKSYTGASVTGDGDIALTDGIGSTTITVTSQDGLNTKKYNIDLYASKVATGQYYYIVQEASGFVVEESQDVYNVIRLAVPMKDSLTQLYEIVESGAAGKYFLKNKNLNYLTLSPSSTWDMLMTDVLTQDLDSCRFVLIEFEPGRFRIESVSKSATEQKFLGSNDGNLGSWIFGDKYENNQLAIWNILPADELVPYDTYLSELTITPGNLGPAFALYIKDYYVVLPLGTTSVTIGAVAHDAGSTVTGTGAIDVSDGKGTIIVKVTATNPEYSTDYRIHYVVESDQLTLEHSYTFANGTAQDVVSNAHGTVVGGVIKDGIYTASANGQHIYFPGDKIAINTYPSITVETYLKDDDGITNDVNTMVAYFGNTTGSYGNDYWFTSLKSRAALSCKNSSDPWSTESGVTGTNVLDDGLPHHLVSVLTYDTVILYLDGVESGRAVVSDVNKIYNLSTKYAYLCKSGYTGDKTWMGQVLEHNIYSGKMDPATVALHASNFPIEDSTSDATLSDLLVGGTTISGFASYTLNYKAILPAGTTTVPEITATTKYPNASAVVNPAATLQDTTKIVVTAADGATSITYTVTFEVAIIDYIKPAEELYAVKVYPTVFKEYLRIESSAVINAIYMYDLAGKLVYEHSGKTYEHNIMASLNRGMYIVQIHFDDATRTFKVIRTN